MQTEGAKPTPSGLSSFSNRPVSQMQILRLEDYKAATGDLNNSAKSGQKKLFNVLAVDEQLARKRPFVQIIISLHFSLL